jgi:hypothetical protein
VPVNILDQQLRELRTAVVNYAAEQSEWSFDPRTLSSADIDAISDVMVNGDSLDLQAVIMLATLRAVE